MECDAGTQSAKINLKFFLSHYLLCFIFFTSPLIAKPSLAAPATDCHEARQVAQKFLDLEWQGKRLYTNKDYDSIMDYTYDNGNEGDEPGWDSANLVESKPTMLKCRQYDDRQISITILYRKIGRADGDSIHLYKHAENNKETLMIRKTGTTYKVSGIGIYEPYVPIGAVEQRMRHSD
jgi:hypothetical protein